MSNHHHRRRRRHQPPPPPATLNLAAHLNGCTCQPDITHTNTRWTLAHDPTCPARTAPTTIVLYPRTHP